jgi:hypothetical protein
MPGARDGGAEAAARYRQYEYKAVRDDDDARARRPTDATRATTARRPRARRSRTAAAGERMRDEIDVAERGRGDETRGDRSERARCKRGATRERGLTKRHARATERVVGAGERSTRATAGRTHGRAGVARGKDRRVAVRRSSARRDGR